MSRTTGKAKFPDGSVLYFVYQGTTDTCDPRLHLNSEAAWQTNDQASDYEYLVSAQDEIEVELATTYGGGKYWKGTASKSKMMLIDGIRPDKIVEEPLIPFGTSTKVINQSTDGVPDWFSECILE